MARNKKIYVINVSDELINMGFPTEIIGSRNILQTIKRFAYENVNDILKLNVPRYYIDSENRVHNARDYFPEDITIEEIITERDIIDQQAKGYKFDIDTASFVKDSFFLDFHKSHNRIQRFNRAVKGNLKPGDWIGYVHSARRNDYDIVKKSIIRNTLRWARQKGLLIPLFSILSLAFDDKEEFMENILKVMSLNKVYDDVISNMQREPDTNNSEETSYQVRRDQIIEDMQDKQKEVLSKGDDTSKEQLGLLVMEKDKLFSIKPTRLETAQFVDNNLSRLTSLSTKVKESKIIERLESESIDYVKGKGINYTKQKRVIDYYTDNPNASLRKAGRDLKMDPRTVKKYKNMPNINFTSAGKKAPKPSIYNINIDNNGAILPSPKDGDKVNDVSIKKRSVKEILQELSDTIDFDRYTKMVSPIIEKEGVEIFHQLKDHY